MCISIFKEMLTDFQVTRPISQNKYRKEVITHLLSSSLRIF